MRKLIRTALIVIGLLLVALIVVVLLVPADALMRQGFAQLEARTGIHATATSAKVSFPWPVGVRLRELRISGPDSAEGAGGMRVQGSANEVVVSAELLSLLRRKPQVREVLLVHPDLELWLPESKAKGDAPPAGGATTPKNPLAAAVGLLSLTDGHVRVHASAGRTFELAGVQQRARVRLAEDGAVTGSIDTELESFQFQDPARPAPLTLRSIKAALRVDGNTKTQHFALQLADLAVGGAQLRGDLAFELAAQPRTLQGTLHADVDLPATLAALGPTAALPPMLGKPVALEGGRLQGEVQVAGALPEPAATADAWLALCSGNGTLQGLRLSALGHSDLAQGGLRWALHDGTLELSELALTARGLSVSGSVTTPALPGGNLRGKVDVGVDVAKVEGLAREIWPALPESMRARGADPARWPALAGQAKVALDLKVPTGKPLDPQLTPVAWDATLGRITIRDPALPDTLQIISGRVQGTMLRADLYNIEFAGPGSRGSLNGGLTGWPKHPEATLVVAFRTLDLDAWMPAASAAQPADKRKAWLTRALPAEAHAAPPAAATAAPGALPSPPENLLAKLVVRADELRSHGYRFTEVIARGTLEKRQLQLGTLQAKLGSGTVVGNAAVDWTKPTPTWSLDAQATALPAADVFSPFAGSLAKALSTTLSGHVQLSGPVVGDAVAVQSHLSGNCDVTSDPGQLRTQPLLGNQLSSLLGTTEAKRFEALDFKSLATILKIQDGKVQFDDLLLDGPTSVSARGSVGLVDQRADYRLTVKLPPGVTPDLGSFTKLASLLRDDQGRITVALRVTGPAKSPKIELDLAETQRRMKTGGQQAIKDKLQQLFPGAGAASGTPGADGGAAPATGSGAASTDSLKEKAGQTIKNLLDNLKKKKGTP